MKDLLNTETDVDEIMRRIREEVERRKKVSEPETYPEQERLISTPQTIAEKPIKKSLDQFLWKYGKRYGKIVKKIPLLSDIARKHHPRLARQFIFSPPITQQPRPSQLEFNALPNYINYHGFLVQAKQGGLKGKTKSFLFKFIRFFAWWQEQINRALYQELMTQRATMDERNEWVQDLLHQQMNNLKKDLSERDKAVEDLNHRLILINEIKDEFYRRLSDREVKVGESERRMEGLLKQQGDHLRGELAVKDKVLEGLGNRFGLLVQAKNHLSRELGDQGIRIGESERRMKELLKRQGDHLRGELAERDGVLEGLGDRLGLLEQVKNYLSRELGDQGIRIGESERRMEGLLKQQGDHLRGELAERGKILEDLGNRLSLFGQAKDELSQKLVHQESKIDETRTQMESLFNQQIDGIRGELSERDKAIGSLNDGLVHSGRVDEELNRELTVQKEKLDGMEKRTQNLLSQGMETLKLEFTGTHQSLREEIESFKKELPGFLEVKSFVHHMMEEMRNHKHEILDQQRRLTVLFEEVRKRLSGPIGPKQIRNILKEEDHLFDAMYVNIEDRFRGLRAEVKERLRVYLPFVKEAQIGERSSPILDLGCGRGEWMELLKENGYIAKGVDFNRVMVRQCRKIGLDVAESDVVEYLRDQQADSFGAITGFQILEHLSLKATISLFDEALRVLKSGGMVIFETPNPENLIVAACNFYLDPTHKHPLPPGLLNFFIESRGFERTQIIKLHPYGFVRQEQETSAAVEALISLFNMEQDYSVIAYKG